MKALFGDLARKSPLAPAAQGGATAESVNLSGKSKPDVSALEKIGFVLGSGRSANDEARETALNTRRAVDLLARLPKAIADAMPKTASLTNV